jgi:hypothetical protein
MDRAPHPQIQNHEEGEVVQEQEQELVIFYF